MKAPKYAVKVKTLTPVDNCSNWEVVVEPMYTVHHSEYTGSVKLYKATSKQGAENRVNQIFDDKYFEDGDIRIPISNVNSVTIIQVKE